MSSVRSVSTWDLEADVVILGAGLAGMVAALEAHEIDPDATIVILEKESPETAGGNSRVSGQSLSFPTDMDDYRDYQAALNEPHPLPERLLEAWVSGRTGQRDWVEQKAAEVGFELVSWFDGGAEFPELPGASCIDSLYTLRPITEGAPPVLDRPHPSGVYLCFKAHLDKVPAIEVLHETRVTELVQDPDSGEVFGVETERGGQRFVVGARRGVVVAMGGFEANKEMLGTYCGYAPDIRPYGSPANTGDAIPMLQKAGAKLWHMRNNTETGGNHPGIKMGDQGAVIRNPRPRARSWFDIGANGHRYYPEAGNYHDTHFKYEHHGRWEDVPTSRVTPVHMIFDEATLNTEILGARGLGWTLIVDGYQWSPDNSAEVAAGWLHKADTVEELALKIGRDPEALAAEVAQFNQAAEAGHDPEFSRDPSTMTPLKAPYYAAEIVAGLICTTGGAMRDEQSRVLGHDDQPIPRLYEAGELGSFHSNLYQNGSFLTEAMFSGRWAGSSAVTQPAHGLAIGTGAV